MSFLWLGTLLPQALDLRSHASAGSDKYGEVVIGSGINPKSVEENLLQCTSPLN